MPLIKIKLLTLFFSVPLLGTALINAAQAADYKSKTPSYSTPSTTITGITGLNVIPNSRMDTQGTMRIGISTTDPYVHSFLGFQIAKPLYVNIRQTAEISGLNDSAQALYPALDFKLRLREETATRPELSIGANSAFGHKRTASEYIVLSKRKGSFDFTSGIAWGRLAGKGHIKNPLRVLSSHFDENRDFNDSEAQNASDWLTGEEIGFFGGVEYFTPLKGLSLKADYGAYNYAPEKTTNAGFNDAKPWSIGLNYKPWRHKNSLADLSLGVIGGEKIMARLSLQDQIQNWPWQSSQTTEPSELIFPRANNQGSNESFLNLIAEQSTGQQIGHTARTIANQTAQDKESIEIALYHKGLKGPNLRLIRRDLEESILNNHGSAEEIWRDVSFIPNKAPTFSLKKYIKNKEYKGYKAAVILDNKLGLSETDSGILYRSSASIEIEKSLPFGFRLGFSPKINLGNNLSNIRTPSINPTRGDESSFAANSFSIDQLYASWLYSINQNTHINLSAGYLEEMFAAYGGEILYRPFGKTFAVGLDAWHSIKRDPNSSLALALNAQEDFTGHLNLFYELPNQSTTLFAKTGRYLDKDFGGTFGIQNNFKNGTKLEAFITATNKSESDAFGDNSNVSGGVKFTLPIGSIPFLPEGSEARFTTAPFSRDTGQALDAPNKLYEVTEPISYRHLSQSWSDLLH